MDAESVDDESMDAEDVVWELFKRESEEKWALFHRISYFLQTAPKLATDAYRAGWRDIEFYPEGYTSFDTCGCCVIENAPGWYGQNPRACPHSRWQFICGPNGEKKSGASPSGYTCLDE